MKRYVIEALSVVTVIFWFSLVLYVLDLNPFIILFLCSNINEISNISHQNLIVSF